jgi:hypothetical protein
MVGSAYNKWLREKAIELAPKPKAPFKDNITDAVGTNSCKIDSQAAPKQDNSQQSSR